MLHEFGGNSSFWYVNCTAENEYYPARLVSKIIELRIERYPKVKERVHAAE
jgi:hypothetical protein